MAKVGVVVKPPATLCPAHDLLSRMRGLPPGCCDHDRDLNGRIGGTSLPAMWPALVSIGTLLKGVGSSPVPVSISRVCPAAASGRPSDPTGQRGPQSVDRLVFSERKEPAVFVRMTLTEGVPDLDAAVAHLRDEVLPTIKDFQGFRGITASGDRKAGVIGILTLWDSEAELKASDAAASQVRENAIKAIGGRLVDVQVYEQVVQEMAAPPAPGSPLLITPTKMDPAKVEENIEFFKVNVLPEIKATPGFRAVRNMINRQTGDGMVGVVLADDDSVKEAEARADARRARATQQGVELGERSRREVLFTALS